MMPPTRLEQLGNFQDSIQSPEGLERLRALQYIQSALPSSQGLMGMPQVSAPVVARQYGGEVGTGGLVEVLDDGTQVFSNTEEGILNRSLYGGMLEGQQQTASAPSGFSGGPTAAGTLAGGAQEVQSMSDVTPLDPVATGMPASLMEMPSVQARGGVYNASEFRDAGVDLATPAGIPETIIQQGQPQTTVRDFAGNIPYDLYVSQPVNTYAQGYDLGGMDYFTANQLALNAGADRFMYGGKYAAVDPGLLSNYKDNMDAGFSEDTAYGKIKPYKAPVGPLPGVSYSGDAERLGNFNLPQNPNSPAAMKAQGYKMGPTGQFVKDTSTYAPLTDYERNVLGMKYRAGGGQIADTAQGLASFGRYGDNILVHMNPEELSGLASLGRITYNPVTGLPEAFSLKGIFKAVRKIAPIALTIAAPYAFGATTALGIGASAALGSFAGNLIAGAKPGDALKGALLSGLFAGGGAYLGGASSGLGGSAAQGGTSAVTSGASGGVQGGLTINNPAFQSSPLKVALQGPPPNISNVTGRGLSQFTGGNVSGASSASLAGSVDKMIPQSNLVFKSSAVPKTYSQSIGSANQIGLGNANVASNIARSGQFSPNVTNQITSFGGNQGASLASNVSQGPTSIFAKGGLSRENLSRMGSQIYDDYANPKGIAKLVGMDLMTPDYDVMYANEAREKEQALREAGYTVDTGFDGQTVIKDSSGVTLPRNLTASMILDRALGRAPRTNLVARTDYATAKEGGLISLKHGGEFSGMVPGDGHGMEDNVYMPIKEGNKQIGTLAVSPSEYVVDSYTMAALGNGNADEGAKIMDGVVESVRKKAYGTIKQPNEISGLQALKPMMERV
jgi:hypothetical protein